MNKIIVQYLQSFDTALKRFNSQPKHGLFIFGQQVKFINFLAKYLILYQKIAQNSNDQKQADKKIIMNNSKQIIRLAIKKLLVDDNTQNQMNKNNNQYSQLNELLFLQCGFRFFYSQNTQKQTSIILVLNHQQFSYVNQQYLRNTFNKFINIWKKQIAKDIQIQIQSKQLDLILQKTTLILFNYDQANQQNFQSSLLALAQSKDKLDVHYLKMSNLFLNQAKRIFYFKPSQMKQYNKTILNKIYQNSLSKNNYKIPEISLHFIKQKYKKQIQTIFEEVNSKYKNIIQIFQNVLKCIFQGNQQYKKLTLNQLNSFSSIYNIKNKLILQKHQISSTDQQKIKLIEKITKFLKKKKNYQQIYQFLRSLNQLLCLIFSNKTSNSFLKRLQFILKMISTITATIESSIKQNLSEKKLKQRVTQCQNIINYLKEKMPHNNQQSQSSEQDYEKNKNKKQIQDIYKKIKILQQKSPFDKFIQNQIFAIAKQLGNILRKKQFIKQAIQCFMVIRFYDQVLFIIKEESLFSTRLTRSYLNKLYKRFIYQNQYFYAQKCIDQIRLRTFKENNYKKIQLMQKKLKLKKNGKQKNINIKDQINKYYLFQVNAQNVRQKLLKM